MTEHEASRTLVKSPPELWAECSDAASLARHLDGSFGEIRITRLEPETAVAWEGELASGTVRLEPSGWGTRVIADCQTGGVAREPLELAPVPEPEPAAEGAAGAGRRGAGRPGASAEEPRCRSKLVCPESAAVEPAVPGARAR